MSLIQLNYDNILSQANGVENLINYLLIIVEKINTECNNITSEGVWEGTLSSKFNGFSSRLNTYGNNSVLNFKTTNEYKRAAVNGFIDLEKNLQGKYKL